MHNQPDDITRQLDEQRMLYMYQGLNAVMALLNQYLNTPQPVDTLAQAYKEADEGRIIAMAAMALKNGKTLKPMPILCLSLIYLVIGGNRL